MVAAAEVMGEVAAAAAEVMGEVAEVAAAAERTLAVAWGGGCGAHPGGGMGGGCAVHGGGCGGHPGGCGGGGCGARLQRLRRLWRGLRLGLGDWRLRRVRWGLRKLLAMGPGPARLGLRLRVTGAIPN